MQVFEGWDSYQLALMRSVTPLTPEQLAFRPAPHLQKLGEVVSHLSLARLWWFHRMGAPGSAALARQSAPWVGEKVNAEDAADLQRWSDALEQQEQAIAENHSELTRWLAATWQMIETTLTLWTPADLTRTYRTVRGGKLYVASRQWTIWRILAHDLHHGGEISLALGMQGIEAPDLGDQGGHLIELPLAEVDG